MAVRFLRTLAWVLIASLSLSHAALAGTTGTLSGRVVDSMSGAALAGATVSVTSPSGTANTLTDGHGQYSFLTLQPDTYTVTVAHNGFETSIQRGVTILADQTRAINVDVRKSLQTIGRTFSRTGGDLVRSGTTADVYSINEQAAGAAQATAGPGGVNQAYGALATVPGVVYQQGQQGYYQLLYIRGGDQDQIGYELDGIPVNRAYDNSPESVLSSFGQKELQVYTGGVPASSDGQGISGYVNQVIKTGTYPSFATADLGLGGPSFYHKAAIEFGGATSDRRLTYYAMTSGVNQDYRSADQYNGASLYDKGFFSPSYFSYQNPNFDLPGPIYNSAADTRDRESIVNLHYSIPHRNSNPGDDLQALYVSSLLYTDYYSSVNDIGGLPYVNANNGGPLVYPDAWIYTGQQGAPLNPHDVSQYFFPYTGAPRPFQQGINAAVQDAMVNTFQVIKLQYQHNLNSRSYVRAVGYNLNTSWNYTFPVQIPGPYSFTLPAQTWGSILTYANQLNGQHLLTVSGSGNWTQESRTASTGNFLASSNSNNPVASYADANGNCYDQSTGLYTSCFTGNSIATINSQTGAISALGSAPRGSQAAVNNARWIATDLGFSSLGTGTNLNDVSPILLAASITDQWKPNDRLTLNIGVRDEKYIDRLADESNGYPTRPFWFAAYNREYCIGPTVIAPVQRQINPTTGVPAACPAGTSPEALSLTNNGNLSNSVLEPRLGATYALNPNSVLRASFGVYARPPDASWVQYGAYQQDLATYLGNNFSADGFNSPEHPLRPDKAYNYDLSLEQHIPRTQLSFKLSPYYRRTQDQFNQSFLNVATGAVSGLNIGQQRSYGLELAMQNGDFGRDGLSERLSFTANRSRIRYTALASGRNVIDGLNLYVKQYNAYTSACGTGKAGPSVCGTTQSGLTPGPCQYSSASAPRPGLIGEADDACAAGSVANPYWNATPQALMDPAAEYTTYDIVPAPFAASNGYEVPYSGSLLVNYKHGGLTVTPSLTYISGAKYGNPLSTPGYDPTVCTAVLAGTRNVADTSTCGYNNGAEIIVPDPYTGKFDALGAFQDPSRLTLNLQVGQDIGPRMRITLAMTGLADVCFQRGYAWDRGFCQYGQLPGGVKPAGNFAYVTDPNLAFPYGVLVGNNNTTYVGAKVPFQAFVDLQVKL